jgi:hypothetical protein
MEGLKEPRYAQVGVTKEGGQVCAREHYD